MKKNYLLSFCVAFFMMFLTLGTKATNYYLKSTGALNVLASWGTNTDGSGTNPTTFNGHTFNVRNQATITMNYLWTLNSASQIIFGDGTTAVSIIFASGASFSGGPKFTFSNACTLTINTNIALNNTSGKTIFNTGSTVIYAAGSGSVVGYLGGNYYDLVVSSSNALNGSIFVNNNLTVSSALDLSGGSIDISGNLVMNANITLSGGVLTLAGNISGGGQFDGDNTGSTLSFVGSGNTVNLNILNPFTISNLTIGGTTTVNLTTGVIIDAGNLTFNGGSLNMNGQSVTVLATGGVDFSGGGTVIGNNGSSLIFNGSITGSLSMDGTNNTLAGLTINSSGQTLTLANTLNILDSVSVSDGDLSTGGNLTLVTGGAMAARVGTIGATGSITGAVNVSYSFGAGATGWCMLGSSVNGPTIGSWDGQFPITCTGCTYGPTSIGGTFYSVQGWSEPACDYDITITSGSNLTPGTGFWVYLGSNSGASSALTWNFSGTLAQPASPPSVPCTANFVCAGGNYNLVANPYHSPISISKLMAFGANPTNFTGFAYYWERTNGATSTPGGGGSDIIAPGQAFYVDAINSASLQFDESVKVNTSNPTLFKQGAKSSSASGNAFDLKLTGSIDADKASFRLLQNASYNYDPKLDSREFFAVPNYNGIGSYTKFTSLSSLSGTTEINLNSFPPTSYSMAIPVLARVSTTGTYTISAENFDSYQSCIVLRDKLTNSYTDLKVSPYICSINDTTSKARFELIVCESGGGAVSIKELYASSNVSIGQDLNGAVVKTTFEKPTDAVISVYNMLGQKLVQDIKVNGTTTSTRIDNLDLHGQVVLIKVTANNQSVTKRIILN